MTFRVTFDFSKAFKELDKFPEDLRLKVMPKALKSAAEVLEAHMRPLMPDGRASGNYRKMSKSAKKKWDKYPQMRDMIDFVVRRPKKRGFGFAAIGPAYPGAYKTHFDYGTKGTTSGRKHVLWGKATRVQPRIVKYQDDFILRTRDEAGPGAVRAFTSTAKTLLDQMVARRSGK